MSHTATYTKLKTGAWGVRVPGAARAGQTVTVTKRDGSRRTETVSRVLWAGDGVSICAIASSGARSSSAPRRSGGSGGCRGCGGRVVDAPHHRAMAGYCGHCAFDEFDC